MGDGTPAIGSDVAVLLVDASYKSDSDGVEGGYYFNLSQEIGYMAEVLEAANSQNIPVFEINLSGNFYTWPDREEDLPPEERHGNDETHPVLAKLRAPNWVQILKDSADAFKGTSLHAELQLRGIKRLVVMGYNQMACVKATAQSALDSGYSVYASFDTMQSFKARRCELVVNGVSMGTSVDNCYAGPMPLHEVTITPTDSYTECWAEEECRETEEFYQANTILVPYYQFPVFGKNY